VKSRLRIPSLSFAGDTAASYETAAQNALSSGKTATQKVPGNRRGTKRLTILTIQILYCIQLEIVNVWESKDGAPQGAP
jgi:hypothetical protein